MFKRIHDAGDPLEFEFEGSTIQARVGDTVAAALLANGVRTMRQSAVSAEPRQPVCLIGVCYECLLEIDGRANRQACMTPVRAGMRVSRQEPLPADGPGEQP